MIAVNIIAKKLIVAETCPSQSIILPCYLAETGGFQRDLCKLSRQAV